MYTHSKKISKFSKRFRSYSDFQKLITDGRTRLGDTIYKEIWHLTMPLVRSYPYVFTCQKLSKEPKRFNS